MTRPVVEVMRSACALLLDFDGPVCDVFSGYPNVAVTKELRRYLEQVGIELPERFSSNRDPLKLLQWVDYAHPEHVRPVEDRLIKGELRAVEQALAILDDLERDQPGTGLCHGDMSGANILRGPNERLYLIDPRVVAGDAAYDAAVLATKARGYGIPDASIADITATSRIEPSRVRAWSIVAGAARV